MKGSILRLYWTFIDIFTRSYSTFTAFWFLLFYILSINALKSLKSWDYSTIWSFFLYLTFGEWWSYVYVFDDFLFTRIEAILADVLSFYKSLPIYFLLISVFEVLCWWFILYTMQLSFSPSSSPEISLFLEVFFLSDLGSVLITWVKSCFEIFG